MRKIISLLGCICVLICCAVPAFALGNVDGSGIVVYTPLQFDEWYSDLSGGPYEWVGNFYRNEADTETVFGLGGVAGLEIGVAAFEGTVTVNSYNDMLLTFDCPGENYTLVANNKLMRLNAPLSTQLTCNYRYKTVRFYGSYLIANRMADGQVTFQRQNFDHTFQFGSDIDFGINLVEYLHAVLEDKPGYDPNSMFFEKLSIDIAIDRDDVDTTRFWYYCDRADASSIAYDFRSWVNLQLAKFDTSDKPPVVIGDFEIGSFLGDSVDAFLDTPIFGDYTFSDVLGVVLVLVVLMFALKMLV